MFETHLLLKLPIVDAVGAAVASACSSHRRHAVVFGPVSHSRADVAVALVFSGLRLAVALVFVVLRLLLNLVGSAVALASCARLLLAPILVVCVVLPIWM